MMVSVAVQGNKMSPYEMAGCIYYHSMKSPVTGLYVGLTSLIGAHIGSSQMTLTYDKTGRTSQPHLE